MDCKEANGLLHGYADRELDPVRSAEIERHMSTCAECSATYRQITALGATIRRGATYHAAPDALRARIRAASGAHRRRASIVPPIRWKWLSAGLSAALAVVIAVGLTLQLSARHESNQLADEIIASHIRSLMADHLTDVASSDQHTVKPWFNGKLDFSPPVYDLAAKGFPLVGGRLDYINDHPVAALVYRRHQHMINLFVWPISGKSPAAERTLSRQGYHVIHWWHSGMTFWAVSDVNMPELREFVQLVSAQLAKP